MADWTANSGFGATRDRGTVRRAEPVLRPTREGAQASRSDKLAATRDREEPMPAAEGQPRVGAGVAALAQYNAALEGPLAKARLAVWAGGGALSLLLIAGVGVWGYKLVLREVMGLPVIAAEDGPMRIVPADPGGEVVPQQGFAVNAIPGAGTAAGPSDVLMLAPQAPGLAEEDMQVVQTDAEEGEVVPVATASVASDPLAVVEDGTKAPPAAAIPTQPAAPVVDTTVATLAAAATTAIDPTASPAEQAQQAARLVASLLPAGRALTAEEILALANQVAAGTQPLAAAQPMAVATEGPAAAPVVPAPAALAEATVTTLAPATATALLAPATLTLAPATPAEAVPAEPAPTATPEITLIAATVPGPAAAPVPPARPAALRTAAAPTAPAAMVTTTASAEQASPVEAAPTPEPAPAPAASVPSGTHMVQLGAFDSPEIAASEWARLQAAHPEFLGGREHVVQEVQSGGATLYRLRTLGFPERADARILCTALTAEGTDCIPVTVD